jgi:hypothetical protein
VNPVGARAVQYIEDDDGIFFMEVRSPRKQFRRARLRMPRPHGSNTQNLSPPLRWLAFSGRQRTVAGVWLLWTLFVWQRFIQAEGKAKE